MWSRKIEIPNIEVHVCWDYFTSVDLLRPFIVTRWYIGHRMLVVQGAWHREPNAAGHADVEIFSRSAVLLAARPYELTQLTRRVSQVQRSDWACEIPQRCRLHKVEQGQCDGWLLLWSLTGPQAMFAALTEWVPQGTVGKWAQCERNIASWKYGFGCTGFP